MTELGTKYKCYKCGCKFYDLGKEVALCPHCGEDQANEESKKMLKRKKRRVLSKTKTDVKPIVDENVAETETKSDDDDDYILDMDDIVMDDSAEDED